MTIRMTEPGRLDLTRRLKFLARDSFIYGGAAAINKAFAVITFPLLARYFSVADYGIIDFFSVVSLLLAIVFIFGQDTAVARYFYEYTDDRERRELISQSFALQMVVALAAAPIMWVMAGSLAGQIVQHPEAERLARIVVLQAPFLILLNFSQNLLKWTFARTRFLILTVGAAAVNLALLCVAILVLEVGVVGVFVVFLLAQALFGLAGVFLIRDWLVLPRRMNFLRELVPFAVPFGIIACSGAFVPVLERSLVERLLGSVDLGLYAAGAKVAMLLALVIHAFQTAWGPFSLAIHKEPDAGNTYHWVVRGFVVFICAAVLMLSAVAPAVLHALATDRYAGATVVVFPLAMGLAIQATGWITEIGISLSKKSYLGLIGYLGYVAGTYLAIRLFTPWFALFGVAAGVMFGHVIKTVTSTWLAQLAYDLPWEFRPLLYLLTATMVAGFAGSWITSTVSVGAGSAVFAAASMTVLVVGGLGLFDRGERVRIRSALRRIPGSA
jgi:O-antigen/teichoic acid export membrane protein